jgi:ATP-binding cassette subfamily A (ABC1) protein 3
MLTGLYPPTAGDALLSGLLLTQQMDAIRGVMGVCPQDNRLWETLTVREHLSIFVGIKGSECGDVEQEITTMLQQIGLRDKEHAQVRTLSGGMKRKLSLGIALIGGSKVVFLDEVFCLHD